MKLWTAQALADRLCVSKETVLEIIQDSGCVAEVVPAKGEPISHYRLYTYECYVTVKQILHEQTRRRNAEIDRAGLPEPKRGKSNLYRKSTRKEKCSD